MERAEYFMNFKKYATDIKSILREYLQILRFMFSGL